MMRIEIKVHNEETGKWKKLDAYELFGKSMMEYMLFNKERVIAGVYEEDNERPTLFITNNETDTEMYRDKGVCISIQDLEKILNTESVPKVVLEAFPDSTFIATESLT